MDIIKAETIDVDDPHGYCSPMSSDDNVNPGIPLVPWRRVNLGDAVRSLHILQGAVVIPPSTTGYMNKGLICKLIDDILEVQRPKLRHLDHIRRRLFINPRETPRKPTEPKKRLIEKSDAFKFKNIRYHIGYRNIKKNYLTEARKTVMGEVELEKSRKRRFAAIFDHNPEELLQPKKIRYCDGKIQISTARAVVSISPEKISEILKFHEKMARPQTPRERSISEQLKRNLNTDACRLSRRVSKLTHLVMQGQYEELSHVHKQMIEEAMRSSVMITLLTDLFANRK